jgi:gliding motility-associated-like protein
MIKSYLFKIALLCVLLCQVFTKASAQYAIGGSAGTNLVNSVYWLTWDKNASGATLITQPAGADAQHIINGTYVWQFSPTVRITAIISNEVAVNGDAMQAYTPGDYQGDGLDLIFSGNNLPKPGSRGVNASGLVTPYGGSVTFDIDIKVSILVNGIYTDVVYPGMIIADAESIDAGGEFITGHTPNAIKWQLLNKRTQGNAADDHYKMDLTDNGRTFKLYADLPPGNFGVQAVMFAHGARNLTNVSMKGSGLTAISIGFVLPFDLGDDPANYGTTGHYMEKFLITDIANVDGTYAVVNYPTTPLVAKATVYLGADNVDADGQPAAGEDADSDDKTGADDESTINTANFPDIRVNQAGNIVLNMPATNTKNVPATLHAWLDLNNDGLFSAADEHVSVVVPANTNNQTFTLTFPNATFKNKIKVGPLYGRFRITTNNLIDVAASPVDERTISFATDGESEDYRFKDILGLSISGRVINDGNGKNNGTLSGDPLQNVSNTPLFAYLVDNSTSRVVNKAAVAADGSYSMLNNNNGDYRVAISTNDVAIGSTITAVDANLPANWVPSGAAYGTNNTVGTGLVPGTPTLQTLVSTPGTSLNVTGVNFALNQRPVATNDGGTTPAGVPIVLDVLANDTDADGTIDPTKVLLIDPADNTKKTTVNITGQGTYTVNTTTGKVTFTPLPAFSGAVTPVAYTIKDNFGTESAIALININIASTGIADVDNTVVNTPVTTNVKANDGSAGTGATVNVNQPAHGTTTVNAAGNVVYTPENGFIGVDTYTYTLTKGGDTSDPITVTINVKPIGVTDNVTTPINTVVTSPLKANDGPSGTGTVVITPTPGAHGTTTVDANGNVIYTPANNYIGKDTYTYTITKNGVTSAPVTVNVTIKPLGVNDTYTTPINTAITSPVKSNDGASATGTTVKVVTQPVHGDVTVNASGTIRYVPDAGYVGVDTYTYTLTTADGVVSDPITVTINIKPVGVNDAYTTPINTVITSPVISNDGPSGTGTVIITPTNGAHGTTTVSAGGSVVYTPANNYIGKDTYTYTITKNGVTSDPITVTINIRPVGVNDEYTTPLNTSITSTVKSNDGPSGTGTTVAATQPIHGTVTVNANGTITYKPDNNFSGVDTYTYTLTTPDGVTSAPITVTVNVNPNGVNDATTTPINTPVTTNVRANDGDSGVGAVVTPTPGAHGTTTVNASGNVVYTPDNGFIGKDTYTYTLTKNGAISPPITVTVSVRPVGVNDAYTTSVNTPISSTVKSNDGPSGIGTTVTPTNGAHGTTTVNAQGVVTYTPANNYVGSDTYTYTLTTPDGVVSAPITVTVTIFSASITLTKEALNSGSEAGDVVNYRLVVRNTGGTTLTNIVVSDAGADAGSISPATIATLAAGASTNVTAKHTLTQANINAGTYSNQASVTGRDPGNNPVTDNASDDPNTPLVPNDPTVITIIPKGKMTLTKTGVFSGFSITYTFVITNTGNTTLNTVKFSDTKLGLTNSEVPNVPAGGLQPGNSVTFTYPYTLAQADRDLGKVDNNASVTALDPAGNTINGAASTSVNVTKSPVAADDSQQTSLNKSVIIDVTRNDNPNGSSFNLQTVEIISPPQHGSYSINANGMVVYTPNKDYSGPDSFTYRVKDLFGYYTNVATVNIIVTPTVGPKIPNLFTPNGDGTNDTFEIRGLDADANVSLIIVNRWGNEVYKSGNYKNNWTGEGLNEGTYYYILNISSADGSEKNVYKGYVTLVRSFKK